MKRFIIDLILILVLVMVGSSMMQNEKGTIEQDIKKFDQQFYEKTDTKDHTVKLNKASQLAKNSSEMIEQVVGVSVEMVATIFHALVE